MEIAMTDESSKAWLEDFVDRDNELNTLLNAYRTTTAEGKPTFISIIAESGIGKTRLIKEFYKHVRDLDDKQGYWPGTLPHDNVTLELNPDVYNHQLPDGFSGTQIPFLWWGVRFKSITDRNSVALRAERNPLIASSPVLHPHFAYLRYGNVLKKDKLSSLDGFLDIALEFGPQIFDVALPGVGLGKTVVEKSIEAWRQRKAIKDFKKGLSDIKSHQRSELERFTKHLIESLTSFFTMKNNDGKKPAAIIILDDLQWLDLHSSAIIQNIIKEGAKKKWPMLIIATCWKKEWSSSTSSNNDDDPIATLHNSLTKLESHQEIRYQPIHLSPISASERILRAGLPGITEEQLQLIQDTVGRDLYALNLLIEEFRSSPRLFENRDINQQLTEVGCNRLKEFRYPRIDLIKSRFRALDEEIQDILGLASLQGNSFVKLIVTKTAENIRASGLIPHLTNDPEKCLLLAESPNHYIETPSNNSASFIEPPHYEIASDHLMQIPKEARIVAQQTIATLKSWLENEESAILSWHELGQFMHISENIFSRAHELSLIDEDSESFIQFNNLISFLRDIQTSTNQLLSNNPNGDLPCTLTQKYKNNRNSVDSIWRRRWLSRISHDRNLLYALGRAFVIELRDLARNEALHVLDSTLDKRTLNKVRDFSLLLRAYIHLSYSLFNDISLSDDELDDFFDKHDELEKRTLSECQEFLTSLNSHLDNKLDEVDYLLNVFLALEHKRVAPLGESFGNAELELTNILTSIPSAFLHNNEFLSLLYHGPLSEILVPSSSFTQTDAYKKLAKYLDSSLSEIPESELELYHLITHIKVLETTYNHANATTHLIQADKTFNKISKLIEIGGAELALDWASFGANIFPAIQVKTSSKKLSQDEAFAAGWDKARENLEKIHIASSDYDQKTRFLLYRKCLSQITSMHLNSYGIDGYQAYLTNVQAILEDICEAHPQIANYLWVARSLNISTTDAQQKWQWHNNRLLAISMVSNEYLTQVNDTDLRRRICESYEDGADAFAKGNNIVPGLLSSLRTLLENEIPKYHFERQYSANTIITSLIMHVLHPEKGPEKKAILEPLIDFIASLQTDNSTTNANPLKNFVVNHLSIIVQRLA